MSATNRRLALSYLIAAAGVVVAGSSHWWLVPLIGDSPPMRVMLIVAVTGSAWLGGMGPGLLATGMGLIAIVVANDSPGNLPILATRMWRFGSLAMLITLLCAAVQTQRNRAERRELEYFHTDLRYRRLVEATGKGIWAIGRDGRTTYANPQMGEILGVPPQQLVGQPLTDFLVDSEDHPRNWLGSPEVPLTWHEIRFRRADGEGDEAIRDMMATARPIEPGENPDPNAISQARPADTGQSDGLLLMVTDVTPLKRAERALREKESLLHNYYELSTMAMGVIELIGDDARLVSANPATHRFFGLGSSLAKGLTARQLEAPPDRLETWFERFRLCQQTGQPVRYECRNLWPNCPEWVAVTLSAMKVPGSEENLCSFIIEDVTERKRTEDDLRVAKERAEAASLAKDRFLAVLSHELRTPLNPVLIAVSSLLESNTEPGLRSALEMIRRNIELESRLIDDLLDLSRIVRGRLRLDLEVVDIHQIIRRAVEICRDEVLVAGLAIVTDMKARQYYVIADYARLMQVTWNLVHNAVKFTPAGGKITIRTSNRPTAAEPGNGVVLDDHPQRVVIDFADTGIGIDAQVLPRIFNAFEQGHDDLRGRSGGLGLGLAISRSLAEAMGGRLTAASHGRGLGSTFSLELTTVSTPAIAAVNRPTAPAPITAAKSPSENTFRILLVEDNLDTLRFLATVLRKRGHEVVTADCIAAARASVKRSDTPFDLLLSDVELPDGNGLELMREYGIQAGWLGIAISGFGTDEDLQLSREAGFIDHLTKPIDLNQLDSAIQRATSHRGEQSTDLEAFSNRSDTNASGEFPIARHKAPL